jgi:hypothetical protein
MRIVITGLGLLLMLSFASQAHATEIDWDKVDAALGKTLPTTCIFMATVIPSPWRQQSVARSREQNTLRAPYCACSPNRANRTRHRQAGRGDRGEGEGQWRRLSVLSPAQGTDH